MKWLKQFHRGVKRYFASRMVVVIVGYRSYWRSFIISARINARACTFSSVHRHGRGINENSCLVLTKRRASRVAVSPQLPIAPCNFKLTASLRCLSSRPDSRHTREFNDNPSERRLQRMLVIHLVRDRKNRLGERTKGSVIFSMDNDYEKFGCTSWWWGTRVEQRRGWLISDRGRSQIDDCNFKLTRYL